MSAALLPIASRAQDATPAPAAAQAQPSSDQQAQQGLATDQVQPQTQQERARILRDAQARVNARRRLREQAIVQDTYSHKYEVYFGGQYLRFHPGPNLQHNTEAGWNVGVTKYIRPKLGITADARGYYGTAITDNFEFQVFKPSISQYTFMAGPQYRVYESQHWAWSAQVLAGVTHGNFSTGTGGFPGTLVGLYPDGNRLAVSAGVPIDYNLGPGLALRLMPNYLFSDYGSEAQHNLGFTVGAVYRWGRQ
ncbi:hypothetical protein [Acidipila sp. EB88]|uniref:hypothetical protein n=1 Tax=Acidipila sp. EB88 TaxID=2305226 RepID=UPI000F5E0656|nr:hypothetical protein [Acidipila sp. EB88]